MPQDEKQIASASYILNFLNDVELLLDYTSAYLNLVVNLSAKYGDEKTIELTPEEQAQLANTTNIVRSLVFKTYTRLNSLDLKEKDKLQKEFKELNSAYKDLENSAVFEFETLKKYVTNLHKIFINSVSLNEMVKSAKTLMEGLTK